MPMKYGRQRLISSKQIGSTLPSAFCSSVTPQRRSTSPQVTPRWAHNRRNSGKVRLISSSRSAYMSWKVEETKTRTARCPAADEVFMSNPAEKEVLVQSTSESQQPLKLCSTSPELLNTLP